jgi:hypothetical protein
MNKDSYYYKNEIKEKLQSFTYDIDEMYYNLENKLRSEIIQNQENKEVQHKEADEMFKKLNYTICNKILKYKLPWKVRLFNNYKCMGYGVTPSNSINISFVLNNNYSIRYEITIGLAEVEKYLD